MDWFLYDNGLRHERVNRVKYVDVFPRLRMVDHNYISLGYVDTVILIFLYSDFII